MINVKGFPGRPYIFKNGKYRPINMYLFKNGKFNRIYSAGGIVIYKFNSDTYVQSYEEGEDVLNPSISMPTKSGYVFGGWAKEKDSDTPLDSLKMGSESITLYAVWLPETYVVFACDRAGKKTVFNKKYCRVPTYKISASTWYSEKGTSVTASSTVNLIKGAYKKAKVEFNIVPNNVDGWQGEREAVCNFFNTIILSSKTGLPSTYTFEGTRDSINVKCTATNNQGTGTWVGIDVYVRKITMLMN